MNASNIVESILEARRAMPLQTTVVNMSDGRTRVHFRPSSKKTSAKPAPAPAHIVTASPAEATVKITHPQLTAERVITLATKATKANRKNGMDPNEALEKACQWTAEVVKKHADEVSAAELLRFRQVLIDLVADPASFWTKIEEKHAVNSVPAKETAKAATPVEQKTGKPIPFMPKPTPSAEAAVDLLFKGLGLKTESYVIEEDVVDAVTASRRPLETIAQIVIHVLKLEDLGWKSRLLTCCEKQVAKHYAANPVKGQTAEQSADKWMKDWLGKLVPKSLERKMARVEVTHRLRLRPDPKPVAPPPAPPKAATPKEKLPDLLTGLLQAAKPSAPPAETREEPTVEPQPEAPPVTVQTEAAAITEQHEEPIRKEPKAAKPAGLTDAEKRRAANKAEHIRRQALQAAKRAEAHYAECNDAAKSSDGKGKKPSKKELRKEAKAGHPCVK
jgi:hypothetical protein